MKSFSFFEIDKQYTDKVLEGLNGFKFEGVNVVSEVAKEKSSGGGSGRSGNRNERQSSGIRDRKRSSGRDRSDKKSDSKKRPRRKR